MGFRKFRDHVFCKIGSVFVKFKLSVLCTKVCVFLRACVRVHAGGECILFYFQCLLPHKDLNDLFSFFILTSLRLKKRSLKKRTLFGTVSLKFLSSSCWIFFLLRNFFRSSISSICMSSSVKWLHFSSFKLKHICISTEQFSKGFQCLQKFCNILILPLNFSQIQSKKQKFRDLF